MSTSPNNIQLWLRGESMIILLGFQHCDLIFDNFLLQYATSLSYKCCQVGLFFFSNYNQHDHYKYNNEQLFASKTIHQLQLRGILIWMEQFCVFWSPLFSAYWGQMRQILTQYCFVAGCVHLNGVVLCVSSRDLLEVLPLNLNLWAESPQHYQMWHQTKAKTSGQLVDLYRWRNSEERREGRKSVLASHKEQLQSRPSRWLHILESTFLCLLEANVTNTNTILLCGCLC